MSASALHIWIWGFSPIIPCRFAQVRWGASVNSHLQVFPMANRFKSGLWLGHADFHVLVLKSFQCCFGCMLGVIVLLERKSSPQFNVFCTLKQVLHKDLPVFGSIHCSLYPYKSPSPCHWKASPSHDTATTMIHERDGVRWMISCARFLPDVALRIQAKEFNFPLIRPQNMLSQDLRVFHMSFCKLQVCCRVPFSQEWLPSGYSPRKASICEVLQRLFSFWQVLPSQPRNSVVLSEWSLGSWLPPWQRSFLPGCSVLSDGQLYEESGSSTFFPFPNDGAHCALGNFQHSRNCFIPFPRSIPPHNSISEFCRQFLGLHGRVSALMHCQLWDNWTIVKIMSNQLNWPQVYSNQVGETYQGLLSKEIGCTSAQFVVS